MWNEIALDSTPVPHPVDGAWPAIAFDGTQYLAVWDDYRTGRSILYGGRVLEDGTALDPVGFPILDAAAAIEVFPGYSPDVAFDGVNFLVVTEMTGQIRGVRVSPSGEVLDPDGFVIAADLGSKASLIFGGEQYLVAWPGQDGNPGIYWARVLPDGTVLGPMMFADSSNPVAKRVAVSFDGTNYLLSWTYYNAEEDVRALDAVRVALDGTLVDETPIRVNPDGVYVNTNFWTAASFDGTNHVIAWDGGWIRAGRITPEGTLLDPNGFAVLEPKFDGGDYNRLNVAASSGRSIVVASPTVVDDAGPTTGRIQAAEIFDDGTVSVHPDEQLPWGAAVTLAAHSDGALLLWCCAIGWEDRPELVGTRLDATATPIEGSVVAPASPASRQEVGATVSDGQNFFVVWIDARDTSLYGARIAADGTPLDEPILLNNKSRIDRVSAWFDGANFVVSWLNFESLSQTVRVSPVGELLDVQPLYPPLDYLWTGASDGTHTLVLGEQLSSTSGVLMDQDFQPVGDVLPIVDGWIGDADASFDGTRYLVVWHDWEQVFGQRVSQAGGLLGQPFSISSSDSIDDVAIASGGGTQLVVWHDYDDGIWATRVSPKGDVLDPDGFAVATDWNDWTKVAVAFNGTNFVIAWHGRSIPDDPSSSNLYAVEVTPEGDVLEPFPISEQPELESAPTLAGGAGRVLVGYSRFVPGLPYDARRAVTRVILD